MARKSGRTDIDDISIVFACPQCGKQVEEDLRGFENCVVEARRNGPDWPFQCLYSSSLNSSLSDSRTAFTIFFYTA